MIFLTIGTHFQGFERLIKEMDKIAGKIDEEVIAQIGPTKYHPKNMKFFTFVEGEKISKLYEDARVIVTHAGAGTILTAFLYSKPVIIVPRLKKYNEIIIDHQLELTEALKGYKNIIVVYNTQELEGALKRVENIDLEEIKQNKALINFLKEYIEEMKQ